MDDTLFTIIKYVVAILGVVISTYVIPYVRLKLKDSKYANLLDFIENAVNAAETDPIFREIIKAGEKKKEYVLKAVIEYMNKNRISITNEQLNILIQSMFTRLDGITLNVNR